MHKELQNTYNSLTTEMSTEVLHPIGFHLLNLKVESSPILTLLPSPSSLLAESSPSPQSEESNISPTAGCGRHSFPPSLYATTAHNLASQNSGSQHRGELC